jgi:hypothetical protein
MPIRDKRSRTDSIYPDLKLRTFIGLRNLHKESDRNENRENAFRSPEEIKFSISRDHKRSTDSLASKATQAKKTDGSVAPLQGQRLLYCWCAPAM